jgi:hypothetical protein
MLKILKFLFLLTNLFCHINTLRDIIPSQPITESIDINNNDDDIISYSDYIITIYSEISAKPCFYFCKIFLF